MEAARCDRRAVSRVLLYADRGAAIRQRPSSRRSSLAQWYAREHVLLCLIPAFFIAGAIAVFINKASVMKYLGARANKALAYGVASVSGSVLAVCSCTVLPLFAGIYRMGAGIGPATAFLYSGPAINILAIVLTARILGMELGVARAVGAILFSVVIGLVMHAIFRKEETAKANAQAAMPAPGGRASSLEERPLLCLDGRLPRFRELGPAPGDLGRMVRDIFGEMGHRLRVPRRPRRRDLFPPPHEAAGGRRMDRIDMGFREADHAAASRRRARLGLPPRPSGATRESFRRNG